MAKYLSVDYKSGTLFEWSGTQKDGFDENTSSTGKVSYRRYERKGILGELLNVGIRDSKVGEEINISQKMANGDIIVSKLSLYDKQGNVKKDFAESFIRLVGNLKKGEVYKFQPYVLTEKAQQEMDEKAGNEIKDKYYERTGVSIKLEDGTKVQPTLFYSDFDNSGRTVIPEIVWKDHPTKQGKRKPSAASLEEKTDFLILKLKEAIDNGLAYESTSNTSNPPASPQASPQADSPSQEPVAADLGDEEYDDLPF